MKTHVLLLLFLVIALALVHSESTDGDCEEEIQGLSRVYLLENCTK